MLRLLLLLLVAYVTAGKVCPYSNEAQDGGPILVDPNAPLPFIPGTYYEAGEIIDIGGVDYVVEEDGVIESPNDPDLQPVLGNPPILGGGGPFRGPCITGLIRNPFPTSGSYTIGDITNLPFLEPCPEQPTLAAGREQLNTAEINNIAGQPSFTRDSLYPQVFSSAPEVIIRYYVQITLFSEPNYPVVFTVQFIKDSVVNTQEVTIGKVGQPVTVTFETTGIPPKAITEGGITQYIPGNRYGISIIPNPQNNLPVYQAIGVTEALNF